MKKMDSKDLNYLNTLKLNNFKCIRWHWYILMYGMKKLATIILFITFIKISDFTPLFD